MGGSSTGPLTPMTVVIGKNGVGKSTLFDVFGFLSDALRNGVEEACLSRGGFDNLRSSSQSGNIEIGINYLPNNNPESGLFYYIAINRDNQDRILVKDEILCRTIDEKIHRLFLILSDGKGFAPKEKNNELEGFELFKALEAIQLPSMTENLIEGASFVELSDNQKLGVSTLGALKEHPEIAQFREFIESWYLSYFSPDAARSLPLAGAQKHLNRKGDNLANVVQFMEQEHKERFQSILNKIAEKIPGIDKISTYRDPITNQLHLLFMDKGFDKHFYAPQMSDGTLKVFAYLLLLEDPNPAPFICIEEPENGLYHKLLETLATEFRNHATGAENSSQLFITTHQPYFVDALEPEEVWVLEKGEDGFSKITRASDIPLVKNMVAEGLPLGGLWYSDYLDAR